MSRPRITNSTWGRTPGIVKDATIRAAVDQVGHYVGAAAASGGFDAAESHLTRSPVTVDVQGWRALAGELEALLERIKTIESDSRQRLQSADHAGERDATVVLMLFNSLVEPHGARVSKRSARGVTARAR